MIWVDIQDVFPGDLDLPGARLRGTAAEATREHRITTSLLPYQRVSWKYNLHCSSRGYHRIGPVRLRSGDIFGFTAAESQLTGTDHILVYPKVFDLRELVMLAEHPLGESKGARPIFRDPSRFLGLRDYQPTDPMKHIDWKATARKSQLQTKLFEPAVALEVIIALNATTGEFAWQGSNRRLFERAVTVAASVSKYCSDLGYSFRTYQQLRGGVYRQMDQRSPGRLRLPNWHGARSPGSGRILRSGGPSQRTTGGTVVLPRWNHSGHGNFVDDSGLGGGDF